MTRTWTTDQTKPDVIRLLCNGVHLASVIQKDDCGGKGWKVNPMSPNHPRSRKYWPTAKAAVASSYGKAAADVVPQ